MKFSRRRGVEFRQWSYRDDDGDWLVVKWSATSTAVYKVLDFVEGGLAWLQAHEVDRASDPLVL